MEVGEEEEGEPRGRHVDGGGLEDGVEVINDGSKAAEGRVEEAVDGSEVIVAEKDARAAKKRKTRRSVAKAIAMIVVVVVVGLCVAESCVGVCGVCGGCGA